MDCANVLQVVDSGHTYSLLKSNMLIPQPEHFSSSVSTSPSHISVTRTCQQHNSNCAWCKSDMRTSTCCTYKSAFLLTSCTSDTAKNSKKMEVCRHDNMTRISESQLDLNVSVSPRCKIRKLASVPQTRSSGMCDTPRGISSYPTTAQSYDSPLPLVNCIMEYREAHPVSDFPHDSWTCKTDELPLYSKSTGNKFKTCTPRKLSFGFSRSRRLQKNSSFSNQDSLSRVKRTPLSSLNISQPPPSTVLSSHVPMKACEKQSDIKEEQPITALVLAAVNSFNVATFYYLNCEFHVLRSCLFKFCMVSRWN
jgi:hypothetical protein